MFSRAAYSILSVGRHWWLPWGLEVPRTNKQQFLIQKVKLFFFLQFFVNVLTPKVAVWKPDPD
jgi:hypothetical protein